MVRLCWACMSTGRSWFVMQITSMTHATHSNGGPVLGYCRPVGVHSRYQNAHSPRPVVPSEHWRDWHGNSARWQMTAKQNPPAAGAARRSHSEIHEGAAGDGLRAGAAGSHRRWEFELMQIPVAMGGWIPQSRDKYTPPVDKCDCCQSGKYCTHLRHTAGRQRLASTPFNSFPVCP